MAAGDLLVMYTYRTPEARRNGGESGLARLLRALDEHNGEGAQAIAAGILRAAIGFSGGMLDDDATIGVVQLVPSES
jgi:serine phosphatase RsbU (regulator of sigma subunit)